MKTLLLLAVLLPILLAAECHGKPGAYYTNQHEIWSGEHRLLRSHTHGKLFQVGDPATATAVKVLHVYGGMYEMGFAHGTLLRDQLHSMVYEVWDYFQNEFMGLIPKKIPSFLKKPFSAALIGTALDLTYLITRPFTNAKYYQEMRGISDASGIPLRFFRRIHMIGQLTKGTCSMFGAWNTATAHSGTIQLRALDWQLEGPFRKYPLLIVYHPKGKNIGQKWMNIGFIGWIGVVSGINQAGLAVSEIGVYFNDETFKKQSRFGNPFTFVLRDILQFDKNLNESIHRLQTTARTCYLILGVGYRGSNNDNALKEVEVQQHSVASPPSFRAFQYSHSVLTVINDSYALPHNDTWHPALQNVVYYGMDWLCPGYHIRLHQMLQKYHGNITAENTIRYILPALNSGDLQAVIYDLQLMHVYISYGTIENGKKFNAYERPYIKIDLNSIWNIGE